MCFLDKWTWHMISLHILLLVYHGIIRLSLLSILHPLVYISFLPLTPSLLLSATLVVAIISHKDQQDTSNKSLSRILSRLLTVDSVFIFSFSFLFFLNFIFCFLFVFFFYFQNNSGQGLSVTLSHQSQIDGVVTRLITRLGRME